MDWTAISSVVSICGLVCGFILFLVKIGKFVQTVESLRTEIRSLGKEMHDLGKEIHARFEKSEESMEKFKKETSQNFQTTKDEIRGVAERISRMEGREEISQNVMLSIVNRSRFSEEKSN